MFSCGLEGTLRAPTVVKNPKEQGTLGMDKRQGKRKRTHQYFLVSG